MFYKLALHNNSSSCKLNNVYYDVHTCEMSVLLLDIKYTTVAGKHFVDFSSKVSIFGSAIYRYIYCIYEHNKNIEKPLHMGCLQNVWLNYCFFCCCCFFRSFQANTHIQKNYPCSSSIISQRPNQTTEEQLGNKN